MAEVSLTRFLFLSCSFFFLFPSTCLLKSVTAQGDDLTGSVLNNFTLEPLQINGQIIPRLNKIHHPCLESNIPWKLFQPLFFKLCSIYFGKMERTVWKKHILYYFFSLDVTQIAPSVSKICNVILIGVFFCF